MSSNTITMAMNPSGSIPIIVGNKATVAISIQNNSTTNRLYNMSILISVPDGISVTTSSVAYTSKTTDSSGVSLYSFINLKDLAPLEEAYVFTITFQCATTFKNGSAIPFQYTFPVGFVRCQLDTMPRGDYDIGNQKVIQQQELAFVSSQYTGLLTTPSKVLKGAGASLLTQDYTQVQTATCTILNNNVSTSTVNSFILLNDSCRYIGNIVTTGTDKALFTQPVISIVTINNQTFTKLDFGNTTLSKNSNTVITFQFAVWDKTNFNNGIYIPHATQEIMALQITGYGNTLQYQSKFLAMEIIISTQNNNPQTDVTNNISTSYTYRVGQYHDIKNVVVIYLLPDGIHYNSSSVAPSSAAESPVDKAYKLTWNFALAIKNSSNTVTIYSTVDTQYRYQFDSKQVALPVVAFDSFLFLVNLTGTLLDLGYTVTDSASATGSISVATIKKQFVKAYYQNGTAKTISTLAPGDLAEYKLTYNASTLKAIQKQVYLDDYFPLSTDPINNLSYDYTGITPANPQLTDPHGVDFNYGDLPGKQTSTIQFRVPIALLGSTSQNNNLLKLKGSNTIGIAYSQRDQVLINIGTPNLSLVKTVAGPNVNAIKSGEYYQYSIVIKNTNTLGTETDAFLFTLQDVFSTWFTYVSGSVVVTGTGVYSAPIVTETGLSMDITKLAPGQQLTLTYQVKIADLLAPGVIITTTATTTSPYSQQSNTSYQYVNLNKSSSTTISAQSITVSKTIVDSLLQVGSPIVYQITITIPVGTIAYSVYCRDSLPSGYQTYLGPSYRNGVIVTPTLTSNYVTFPSEGTLDARINAITVLYQFTATIVNATKTTGSISTTQTNTAQLFYKQTPTASNLTVTSTKVITIQHPNYVLTLSAQNNITGELYTQSANITTNTPMLYRLTIVNNSLVTAVNGTVEIPVDINFAFKTIEKTSLCTAAYNATTNKIVITIPLLTSTSEAQASFILIPNSNTNAGSSLTTQATATQYFNTLSNKVYGGEQSNIFTCNLLAGVSLVPSSYDWVNDSTSYRVSQPGQVVSILNYFSNTGGGIDSYTMQIEKVAIPYMLYVDDVLIATVSANTLFFQDISSMQHVGPNEIRVIKIVTTVPITAPLGFRYDFIATATSKTSPYPKKSVINIDPN